MIPEEKNTSVRRALKETFGVTEFEDIRKMTGGLSSDLVFRIVVHGSPLLLRIMTSRNEMNDPVRIFTCMKMAAEAGLAPRILYSNAEDGIAIINFVEAVSLPLKQALVYLPQALRKLHGLPSFPKAFNYVTAHKGFIWRLRKANLLPQEEIEEVFTRYEQLCAVYPRVDADIVSCHMDLKPENILFDGHCVWLIDWMAAALNDRFFDLAIVANFVVTDGADELTFLEQYFGGRPDEYQCARFFLMRQVLHMFAAAVFLLLGSAGKPINLSETLPSFRAFHEGIWAGEVNLADNDLKAVYGMVHWKQLLQNTRETRFSEALRIVSDRDRQSEGMRPLLPAVQ